MPQPSLTGVVSWCQDWFYRKPNSLQCQIDSIKQELSKMSARSDALNAAVAALQKQSAAIVTEVTTLKGQVGEAAVDAAAMDAAVPAINAVVAAEAAVAPAA